MKITLTRFKMSLLASLLAANIVACTAPEADANPTPGATPTSREATPQVVEAIAAEVTNVSEGEGEETIDKAAAAKVQLTVWKDKFDGTPLGNGKPDSLVLLPDNQQLPGLRPNLLGMKKGAVRRLKISAKELMGDLPKHSRIKPNDIFYIEATLADLYAEEPFEIKTVKEGKGDVVTKEGDVVKMHYTGHLTNKDGKVFDSSHKRGVPFVLTLGQGGVIPGWEKGLLGMKEGEHRTLSIPHYLAYGDQQKGDVIKPKSRLFFEVEFVGFVKPGKLISKTTKEGSGEAIKAGEVGKFHYTGWLDGFNGKEKFDSSRDPGRQPFQVKLGAGQVIKGWDEGLVGMKPGEIRQLEIPYNLAYGERGQSKIPPYATLFFEVEYLGIGE